MTRTAPTVSGTVRAEVPTGDPAPVSVASLDRPGLRSADGATLAAAFAVVLMLSPARLVFRGLPFSLTPADAVGLFAALWWFCAQLTTTLGAAKGSNPVRTALFVYTAAMLATYGYASAAYLPPDELDMADHSIVLVVAAVGIGLGACDGIRGRERLDFVLRCLVISGAAVGVIAALQFVLEFDLTKYLTFPGFRFTSDLPAILERNTLRRVAATTGHPIELGVVCAMITPLALHYAFGARDRGEPSLRWWVCCALIGTGLMFSVSRSAVLGLAVVGVVLVAGWPARRRLWAALGGVGFLVAMKVAVPGLISVFLGLFTSLSSDSSIQYRTHDYAVAATEIGNHFWVGRGLGTWYAPKHLIFDNQYILSLVETGVIGLAAFSGIFLTGIWAALRVRRLSSDPAVRDLGLTLAACLVVPLVGAATFDLRSFATVTGLSFLIIGAAGSLLRATRQPRAQAIRPPERSGGEPGESRELGEFGKETDEEVGEKDVEAVEAVGKVTRPAGRADPPRSPRPDPAR
ncbi:O-antigen ligase family protein [Streptosporangium sp. H16]|uniref:O-antigen ligase family protein n=1 Tax=Streptosporangium sp. H16 TaxID=3444184 RepID=UPI003F7A4B77